MKSSGRVGSASIDPEPPALATSIGVTAASAPAVAEGTGDTPSHSGGRPNRPVASLRSLGLLRGFIRDPEHRPARAAIFLLLGQYQGRDVRLVLGPRGVHCRLHLLRRVHIG